MISPLASPFRGGFRNLTPMRGRGRGGANPWTPVQLAPYAWYDVHAGGTSTTIADTSGNGRADATYGATTAAPLYLPYTGTAYVHLEAATAGTNSISCTAPANTASYAAYPLGGGAATTGAASAGAFTFTTDGDWTRIDLLNGSAVVLASFRAADSAQTGHTDAYSVAWAINRGTAGRRTAVLGPGASATRSMSLLATNDSIEIPSAAIPNLDADFAIVAVHRMHSYTAAHTIFAKKANVNASDVGVLIRNATGTPSTITAQYADGVAQASPTVAGRTASQRVVATAMRDQGATVYVYANNTAGSTADTTGVISNAATPYVGRVGGVGTFGDFEFEALLTFDRLLTTTEIGQLVTYYGG